MFADLKPYLEYGIFCVLFMGLFGYTIRRNDKMEIKNEEREVRNDNRNQEREEKYQTTIKTLGETIGVTVCESNRMAKDVAVVCDSIYANLRTINGEVDKVKTGVFDVKETVDDVQMMILRGKAG